MTNGMEMPLNRNLLTTPNLTVREIFGIYK